MVIGFLVSVLFVVFGIAIKYFKWYWLIAGYNTMTKEEKKRVEIEKLANYIGNLLFVLAAVFLVTMVLNHLGQTIGFIIGLSVFLLIILMGIYRAQSFVQPAEKKKRVFNLVFIMIVLIALGSIALVLYGSQSGVVEVSARSINITGIYGTEILLDEIKTLELRDSIPVIERKINGFNAGSINRGTFKLKTFGEGKIYLEKDQGPYIFIETEGGFYIINNKDSKETGEIYEKIHIYWQG